MGRTLFLAVFAALCATAAAANRRLLVADIGTCRRRWFAAITAHVEHSRTQRLKLFVAVCSRRQMGGHWRRRDLRCKYDHRYGPCSRRPASAVTLAGTDHETSRQLRCSWLPSCPAEPSSGGWILHRCCSRSALHLRSAGESCCTS